MKYSSPRATRSFSTGLRKGSSPILASLFFVGALVSGACSSSSTSTPSGTAAGATTGAGASTGAGATTGAGASTGAGATTGAGASTGAGATTGAGASTGANACEWSGVYTGPALGRCSESMVVADGGYLTIDHFDDNDTNIVASRDGRTGNWWEAKHDSVATIWDKVAPPAGGPVDSVGAFHYTASAGSEDAFSATLGVDVSTCYDARAYEGLTFWFKGDPAAGHKQVKLSLHSPPTQPATSGGACESDCYDHYAIMLEGTGAWTEYRIPWSDFKRLDCTDPTPGIPENFQPQAQIVNLSFSQPDATAGVDFWIDDLRFFSGTLTAQSTFKDIVTEAIFDELFAGHHANLSYAGLMEAVDKCVSGAWPACSTFTTEGTLRDRILESAAFLAQVAHETASMSLIEETGCGADGTTETKAACVAAYRIYHGRGALQLTHKVNYQGATSAFGEDLVNNPNWVMEKPYLAWGTALWFWSTEQSAKGICHDAIVKNRSFGGTTSIINGIDCGKDKSQSRINLFKTIAFALGVNPYTTNLDCTM